MLKLHRKDPNRTGRQALVATRMALLTIDGYIKQVEYDFSHHATTENQAFLHGFLMSFDPFTNKEIHEVLMEDASTFDPKKYFVIPIKCLLRIEKSIELWTKKFRSNGYFNFIENHMGHLIEYDDKMNFFIMDSHDDTRD